MFKMAASISKIDATLITAIYSAEDTLVTHFPHDFSAKGWKVVARAKIFLEFKIACFSLNNYLDGFP